MQELQLFNFNGTNIRTLLIEDEPYFVGKEVAEVLGYQVPQKAITDHVEKDERKTLTYKAFSNSVPSLWQGNDFSNKTVINESGVYSLIFSSELPQAKEFKRWVTKEVLPAIRKHGAYSMNDNFGEFASLPLDQQLLQIAGAQSERLDKVEAKVTDLVENRRIDSSESQNIGSTVHGRVRDIVKRNNWDYTKVRNKLYAELNGEIKKVFNVANRGYIKSKDVDKVIEFINCWEPSSATRFKIKQMSLFE